MSPKKIGLICDMHLSADRNSPQLAFFKMAVERMRRDKVEMVLCLGDITAFGEIEGWELYQEVLGDLPHVEVIGNSDVRDEATKEFFLKKAVPVSMELEGKRLFGIHTPDGAIAEADRAFLAQMKDGDILALHHYPISMLEESRQWFQEFLRSKRVTVLHGHGHRVMEEEIGASSVYGMRGLDPDKAIGGFPSVCYLELEGELISLTEQFLAIPAEVLEDVRGMFGLSCVDNEKDLTYAIEHGVKYVELRLNGWTPDLSILPLVEKWRNSCDGYLSIHMPNLHYIEGSVEGTDQWETALAFAASVKADSFTMHPPRAAYADMDPAGKAWKELLPWYLLVHEKMPAGTRMGIENLHAAPGEVLDETRKFGYTPMEVAAFIDALNEVAGEGRYGHILDVGHARNNGVFAQMFPVSRWYSRMGKRAIAYHIHQIKSGPKGMKNHNPIEDWLGPVINYTSFFYAWQQGMLAHSPVFLEVQGSEHFDKSVKAFDTLRT